MHLETRTRKLTLTEGITAGILFGTAAIFIRYLQNLDVFSIAFWRLIIACSILTAVLLVSGKLSGLKTSIMGNLKELLVLGIFLGLHFIFFVSAVKDTTILNATVLVNTTPIFSVFISAFLFNLKPSRLAMVGITISVAGACIIAYAESAVVSLDASSVGVAPSVKGDVEAVLAAFVEALYLNYGKRIRGQKAILPLMLPIYLFAAFVIGVLSPIGASKGLQLPMGFSLILPLLGLGALPTAAAHTLYFSSLSNLKSFETATMALLEPIGATVLGAILFGEFPAPLFVSGTALVLLGIVFIAKEKG
ncbi:MAG: DMT family transporter [Candidatus Bathyarchaeota archaeon]|nr:DMT family transporter [Candidatus Bathyarchaeota archaeon A05DMB-3]MDH7606784.1 DMT family transporter [Candidatus Bathyarchaeota archaeon]